MKSCERLDMLSLNLSHKNLLVPLLVCKQSVSPGPSVSRRSYLVHLNLPPALHFLPFPHLSCPFQSPHFVDLSNFCLSALFSSSFFYTIYVLLSFFQFHFSSHYTFFLIPFLSFIMSLVLLLTASASCHCLLCLSPFPYNALLQYLPLLSAVLPLIRGYLGSIPTTLRLTGVKGFGTGRS